MNARVLFFLVAGLSSGVAALAFADPQQTVGFPPGPIQPLPPQIAPPMQPSQPAPPQAPQVAPVAQMAQFQVPQPAPPFVARPLAPAPVQALQAPAAPPQFVPAPAAPPAAPYAQAAQAPLPAPGAPSAAADPHPRPWLAAPVGGPAQALSGPAASPGASPATADAGPSPIRIFAVLLFVALLGGAALFAKHAKNPMTTLLRNARMEGVGLRIVDSTRIGPRAQLVVAEFNGRRFLIGVNDASIRRLAYLGRSAGGTTPARVSTESGAPGEDYRDSGGSESAGPVAGFTDAMRRALSSSASQPLQPVAVPSPYAPPASRAVAMTPSAPSVNAADLLASETRDVVELGAGARMNRVLSGREPAPSSRPADVYTRTPGPAVVEEQVAGLTRRRIQRRGG